MGAAPDDSEDADEPARGTDIIGGVGAPCPRAMSALTNAEGGGATGVELFG